MLSQLSGIHLNLICSSRTWPQMACGTIARQQQRDLPADGARHDCAPAAAGPARRWRAARLRACISGTCPQMMLLTLCTMMPTLDANIVGGC